MRSQKRTLVWALTAGTLLLALSLAGFWVYVDLIHPLPFYTVKYDPEMPYMLNSLAIFKSRPYQYYDHPGTPVELIGTVILALMRPVLRLGSDAFWTYLLAHPEVFLRVAHGLLTLGSVATLSLICMRAVRVEVWSDVSIALGAGASYFVLLPEHALRTLNFWSHNSFSFPAGTLILLVLLLRLRSAKPVEAWEVALAGIVTGLLTAVQLYFATWVLGAAVSIGLFVVFTGRGVFRGLAAGAGVGLGAALGFLMATGPILHRYRDFAWWVRSLVVHQGRFGQGPTGVATPAGLLANLRELWTAEPGLFIGAGLALALLGVAGYLNRSMLKERPGWWALALGIPVQFVAVMLLIAKHPAPQYLLAPAAIAPMLLVLALEVLRMHGKRFRSLSAFMGGALLVLFAINLFAAINRHSAAVAAFEQRAAEVAQQIDAEATRLGKSPDSMIILWGWGMEERCYALRFGDRYTGRAFNEEINEICANDWTYEASVDVAELPDGSRPLGKSSGWDMLIVQSSDRRSDFEQYGRLTFSTDGSIVFLHPAGAGP